MDQCQFTQSHNGIAGYDGLQQFLRHMGTLTQLLDEGVLILDLKDTVHFVNTAWARMHGYNTGKELLGSQLRSFHSPDQMKGQVSAVMAQARRTGTAEAELARTRRDGTVFVTRTRVKLLLDKHNKPVGYLLIAAPTPQPAADAQQTLDSQNASAGTAPSSSSPATAVDDTDIATQLREQLAALLASNQQQQKEIIELRRTEQELHRHIDRLVAKMTQFTQPPAEPPDAPQQPADQSLQAEGPKQPPQTQHSDDEETDTAVVLDAEKLGSVAELAKRLR